MSPEAVQQRISRVAERSMRYRYYHWDWGEAINIEGLLGAWRVTKDERFANFVRRMVDGWLLHSPDPFYPDHVAPGRGPVAASGPSSLACIETARTAALKSPSAAAPPGSGTGARS